MTRKKILPQGLSQQGCNNKSTGVWENALRIELFLAENQ